jgi:Helix-turn-helix domain
MGVEIITKDDLEVFRKQLLEDIRELFEEQARPKKWLKTNEVLKLLKMSDVTLQHLRSNGTIPFKKLGGICYYDIGELEKVLTSSSL